MLMVFAGFVFVEAPPVLLAFCRLCGETAIPVLPVLPPVSRGHWRCVMLTHIPSLITPR